MANKNNRKNLLYILIQIYIFIKLNIIIESEIMLCIYIYI
jgi:hypothetical protein